MTPTLEMEQNYTHEPVLLDEVVEALITDLDGTYLDATLGLGGHSEAILKKLSAQGQLIGTDMDPEALGIAARRLQPFAGRFRSVRANFRNLSQIFRSEVPDLGDGLESVPVQSTSQVLVDAADDPGPSIDQAGK